jgi:cysteine desulfurase
MRGIYMDANATTPLLPEVVAAMQPFWGAEFGNPSSVHRRGQHARSAVDHGREQVAALLGCQAAEVIFTSGGTESDNLALFGMVGPGDHLIVSAVEHHAVLHAAAELEGRGAALTHLPVSSDGVVAVEALAAAMRANTKLVSVMLANNETGVVQPIAALAEITHAGGALFHTDAVQGAGKLRLEEAVRACDLLSIAGHKMYAPQGTGALYVRRGVALRPMLFGGTHERQRRAGTENVAGLAGFGRAAEMAREWLAGDGAADLADLRHRLERGLLERVEATVNGGCVERVANTANIAFAGVEAEALVIALDLQGLAVSGGAACQSGATTPSHVLTAMGMGESRARGSVRFSLSRMTTEDEVDRAGELVVAAVARLRALA